MSSDRKDPGAIWQGPTNSSRSQPSEGVPPLEQEELPAPSMQQQVEGQDPDTLFSAEQENDPGDAPGTNDIPGVAAQSFELMKPLWHYVTLLVLPILFGVITCLLVLPAVASGHASLPPAGLWPIAFVFIAITIGQVAAIYYTGAYNSMWLLCTIGGFCLFLLVGCFAIFGPLPGTLLFVVLVVILGFIARRSIHPVPEGYVDIVFSSGKYSRTLYPGFNLLWPWEQATFQLNVEETQWICPAQIVQLSRDEDIILRAVISYQVVSEDAQLAVTQVNNWEESLRTLLITTLQTVATVFVPDDFLTWPQGLHAYHGQHAGGRSEQPEDDFTGSMERRARINDYLFQHVRDKVALWGIQVNWINIRDIELAPHGATVIDTDPVNPAIHAQPTQVMPQDTAREAHEQQKIAPVPQAAPAEAPQPVARRDEGSVPKLSEQQEYHQPPPTPAPQTPPPLLKEEILVKAYREVQNGKITDAETIRNIAASFEAVAKDPQASQAVSFDPSRAAYNLYEQARKYEEQQGVGAKG